MAVSEIKELLNREPFQPFRVCASNGRTYDVRDPMAVAVMKTQLFIALPDGERWAFVPNLHTASVEAPSNGHPPRPRRMNR